MFSFMRSRQPMARLPNKLLSQRPRQLPQHHQGFRLERAVPPPTIAADEGLLEGGAADTTEFYGVALSTT